MAVLTRVARLFRADLHALLDRMEAPDVLLQQAIREMEAEILARQQGLRQQQQQLAQLNLQQQHLDTALQQGNAELTLCLDAENDALARSLLRRKLEQEKRAKNLLQRTQHLQQLQDSSGAELRQQQQTLAQLVQQAELYLQPADELRDRPLDGSEFSITDADVELALLKEKSKRRPQ